MGSLSKSQCTMGHRKSWLTVLAFLALLSSWTIAQEEGSADEEASGEEPAEGGEEGAEAEEGDEASGDDGEEEADDGGDEDEEDCEVEETDGSGSGDDDVANILALGGESKKCKSKSNDDEDSEESGSSEELSGADALADAVGATTCDKDGMDEKVAECLGGLEDKVNDLMTAIMGPEGGGGTLEDKITLVLVKKGVISCENETQCDDNKQCLKQTDGMSRCQDPCERPEIIHCSVPFSECVTEDHTPSCRCKENFHGNGTEVCIPMGFDTEENKRGYRMFDEEYLEWENATQKCQELGARLPVLSDAETIKIVKKYLETADFDVFEQWDRSSRRVWLGLQYSPSNGLTWVDGQRIVAYPASSRLFVWESRRLLSQEASYADNARHYGYYIDGDIAKLPGGGRRGAAVLCELIPGELASDPNPHQPTPASDVGGAGSYGSYPGMGQGGYRDGRNGAYPSRGRYPSQDDGGYPSYPQGR